MLIVEIFADENGMHNNTSGAFQSPPEGYVQVPETLMEKANTFLPFANLVFDENEELADITENAEAKSAWTSKLDTTNFIALRVAKLDELSAAAQAAIIAGCDVTLSDGTTGHISLTPEDQINLSTAQAAVQDGAAGYPYHLDGQLCKVYATADILTMAKAAVAHILYHTTYCNHLRVWTKRVTTSDELTAITYGATLPDDLAANMEAIISAASA